MTTPLLENEVNPFLIDVPLVTIVKLVRVINGVEVETPENDCARVWGRVNRAGAAHAQQTELVTQPENGRVFPDHYGRDNLRSY